MPAARPSAPAGIVVFSSRPRRIYRWRERGVVPRSLPQGGQLGTDLNRDILWKHLLEKHHVQGIRQIALDEVWSAIRFRPAK
jgi:hypothetical protein